MDYYLWQSLSYIGQYSNKMNSSENLTNLKAGIEIKNVPWLDKRKYVFGEWFNKLSISIFSVDVLNGGVRRVTYESRA